MFLGLSVYQCIVPIAQFFFLADDWRYRHAGLMAISAVAEGCKKQMEPLLKSIVEEVLLHLTDQVQFFLSRVFLLLACFENWLVFRTRGYFLGLRHFVRETGSMPLVYQFCHIHALIVLSSPFVSH